MRLPILVLSQLLHLDNARRLQINDGGYDGVDHVKAFSSMLATLSPAAAFAPVGSKWSVGVSSALRPRASQKLVMTEPEVEVAEAESPQVQPELTKPRMPELPMSPEDMIDRAAGAVARAKKDGKLRQIVKMKVPRDTRTYKVLGLVEIEGTDSPEDLDPWPGGYPQQYPIVSAMCKNMMATVMGTSESKVTDQILSAKDASGWVWAEGESALESGGCVVQPGVDSFDKLEEVEKSVTDRRLLVWANPQFTRLNQFQPWTREQAKSLWTDKNYERTYVFEETNVRSEEVKVVLEYPYGWRLFVDGEAIHEGCLPERPNGPQIEAMLDKAIPKTFKEIVMSSPMARETGMDGKSGDASWNPLGREQPKLPPLPGLGGPIRV